MASRVSPPSTYQLGNSYLTNRTASLDHVEDELRIWVTALKYAVETMGRQIRHFRQERNGITTFGRLPTEVLLNIAEWASITTELHLRIGRITLLHRLSWVCQSWRHTLFACPNIWTTISTSEATALLEHALSLSRSQPLIIRDDPGTLQQRHDSVSALWKLILTQRGRWKDVEVIVGKEDPLPNSSTQPPALQLKTLKLSPLYGDRVSGAFQVPSHFVGPILPHLRHLILHRARLRSDFPRVNHLQVLHLKRCSASWADLWLSIHSSPNLIDLELRDNDYTDIDREASPAREFSSLKRLNVAGTSNVCTLILLQLIILDCDDLAISAHFFVASGAEPLPPSREEFIESVASTLNNSYKLSQDLGEVALTVNADGGLSVSMSASRWTVKTKNYRDRATTAFGITKDLYRLLHLPPNPSIYAKFEHYVDYMDPRTIYALYQLPQIKTLQSTVSRPEVLISHMTQPDADGTWLFPQMSRLTLGNLDPLTTTSALEDMVRARRRPSLAPLEVSLQEG